MPSLRSDIIKLAHANPELRPHLLPLVKKAGFQHQLDRKYQGLVSSTGRALDWSIDDAFAFCVALLEDVNAHKEAAAVDRLLAQF